MPGGIRALPLAIAVVAGGSTTGRCATPDAPAPADDVGAPPERDAHATVGADSDDVIVGGGGADVLYSASGDDWLSSGGSPGSR